MCRRENMCERENGTNEVRALRAVSTLLAGELSRRTRDISLGDFTLDMPERPGFALSRSGGVEIHIITDENFENHSFYYHHPEFRRFIQENGGSHITDDTRIYNIDIIETNLLWKIECIFDRFSKGGYITYMFCVEAGGADGTDYEQEVTYESVMRMLELAKNKNCLSVHIEE